MFGKKNKLGYKPKVRLLDEINKDYNHHAAQAGHKSRIILEIQDEVNTHLDRLRALNEEAKLAPKEEPKKDAPAAPAEKPA